MPFKSDKQRKWMYANDPEMAKKWEKEEAIRGKLRNVIRQEIKEAGFLRAKQMVFLPDKKMYFDPMSDNLWLMGPYGGPDLDDDPIEPTDRDYKQIIRKLSGKDKSVLKKAMRTRKRRKEATTSVSVPGYLSPHAFKKSTQQAIDIDDEDDEVEEAYKVDIDKLLQSPKIKKLMKRLGIRKSQSQQGAIQLLNYFANNPHALAAFKKLAVGESMAAPFRRRKSRGLGRPMKVGLNELSMAPFSSPEARLQINSDIKDMSNLLGKTSQQVIKIMMNGVKKGKYTAMDIARGIKEGPTKRTHFGEMTFIQSLWNKMREKFRKYSKDGKLS